VKEVDTKVSRRKLVKRGLFGLAGLLTLDALVIEPRLLSVEKIRIPIQGLDPAFEGFRIVQLSDFHCGPWIDPHFVRDAGKRAMEQKPDILVYTGDFVEGRQYRIPDLRTELDHLKAPNGVLGVLGNHDGWAGTNEVVREVERAGTLDLLVNRRVIVERGGAALAFVGLADLWTGKTDLPTAFKGIPKDVPRILLQHNPDYANDMEPGQRVDLQLAGHTHGGQLRTPWGYAPKLPSRYGNKFREGLVQGTQHQVFVNRGIGGVVPLHPRLFCLPQISVIELTCV